MAANESNSMICVHLMLVALGIVFLLLPQSEGTAEDVASNKNLRKCNLKNSSHGLIADCNNLGLRAVPQHLPIEVNTLALSSNNLTTLHDESFKHLPNLVTLAAYDNPLSVIENKALWPLTMLRLVILHHCNLQTMSPLLFVKNTLLTKLELGYNQLDTLPCESLAAIPRLSKIELVHNKIKSLNFKGCSRWSHLTDVNLRKNEVQEVHQSDFLPLQNTTVGNFSLFGNKIHNLSTKVFSHLTSSIDNFILQGNPLKPFDIRPFLGMTYINKLSISTCKIDQLLPPDNASDYHTPYPSILTLDVSKNSITNVPPGSFWGFIWLKMLILSDNKISSLSNESFYQMTSLIELNISSNKLVSLPPESFACVPNLTTLDVSKNLLQNLSPQSFDGMLLIRSIFLYVNRITDLNSGRRFWTIGTLRVLDISYNDIAFISHGTFTGLTSLQVLDVSNNQVNSFSKYAFTDLILLRKLHLSKERAVFLKDTFKQLRTLHYLDLSYTQIKVSQTSIEQFYNMTCLRNLHLEMAQLKDTDLYNGINNRSLFSGLFSLKKLLLNGNYLVSLDKRVFHNLSNVYYLDMSKSRIQVLRSGVFSPLTSLRFLYLRENKLVEMAGDIFHGLYQLRVVYIPNNMLSGLEPTTFAQAPRLTVLSVSGNQISTVERGTVLPANTSLRLNISRNPFTCTCSLTWFRQWLQSADIDLQHPDKTLCSKTSLQGLVNQPIMAFHPEDHCGADIVLITILTLTGVVIVMISMLAYNKRWWLNHKLFLLKLAVIGYEEMAEDFNADNYRHHLNLMFDEAEQEWVDRVMRPALEERMPHLQNTIFGDEDLHLGMYYIPALYDAIDNSFKTVLLLSNQSVNDAWTMTKLRMALEHLNDSGLDKVILIFVKDIEDGNMPYLVRLFLSRNKPYMLWTDDEDGQELFWAQFGKSMRANKAINNAIPL
ncbi:toll-like receptor 3 [Strongylocentrotus purpuratus]|uniref:TIR domain-containing protein n=1 Tax=Strongylocentrotus purpuratus TaxID=7668 RepID=A0A7M7NSM8_STRPU|nr:toll-like receptor 3 [Strongylocentrotus purpuratus]